MLLELSKYFEDLAVNERFLTGTRTVTETDLVSFVGFMRINNPLFVDLRYAERSIFHARIVPGPLILTIAMGLLDNLGLFSDSLLALLSIESKFLAPVKVGDTIYVESTVLYKHESSKGGRGVITLSEQVLNQEEERVLELKRNILLKLKNEK